MNKIIFRGACIISVIMLLISCNANRVVSGRVKERIGSTVVLNTGDRFTINPGAPVPEIGDSVTFTSTVVRKKINSRQRR